MNSIIFAGYHGTGKTWCEQYFTLSTEDNLHPGTKILWDFIDLSYIVYSTTEDENTEYMKEIDLYTERQNTIIFVPASMDVIRTIAKAGYHIYTVLPNDECRDLYINRMYEKHSAFAAHAIADDWKCRIERIECLQAKYPNKITMYILGKHIYLASAIEHLAYNNFGTGMKKVSLEVAARYN